jgi:pyruvate dehydrogenase E2 component (dihydrolipoamide acetyltransferase)
LSQEIFLLPDVGEGLIEAEIVTWKVAVGDVVTLNQALVDVETAKATVELPSPFAGTIVTLHGEVGDTMQVNQPLVTIEVGAQSAPHANEKQVVHDETTVNRREPVLIGYGVANEDAAVVRRTRRVATGPTKESVVLDVPDSPSGPVRSTPPVRLLAKQYGIDLAAVSPTGRDGLVTRDDVERARSGPVGPDARRSPITGPASSSRFVGREIASWSSGPREERIPVKGVLKSMAEAMVQSSTNQPQAAVWLRVDATKTMELLEALKAHPNFAGVRLSPLTIAALAVCDAARHFPGINSSFDTQNNEVVVRRYVNLGIAADTPRGLIVPNIKDADQLDVVAMASALSSLVQTARSGTTTPNDMLGTTLTITNVGPFGVDAAMAILPPGTAAILCIGKIAKAPWVVDDRLAVRQVVELAMTFDHRQVDGALASAVLAHIGRFLEDPATTLLAQ